MKNISKIIGVFLVLLISFTTLSQDNSNASSNNNENGKALKWYRQENSIYTSNFIESFNDKSLKTNNEQSLIITPVDNVGVEILKPLAKFDVLKTIHTRENLKVFSENHPLNDSKFETDFEDNFVYETSSGKNDSLENDVIKSHGVYLELLGTNVIYALGYEFHKRRNKHAVGFHVGSGVYPNLTSSVKAWTYTISVSTFYEYGKKVGFRTGLHLNNEVNPIMFTDKLIKVHPSDKPSIYGVLPSLSLGVFKTFLDNRLQLTLKGHMFTSYRKHETLSGYLWYGFSRDYSWFWTGLTVKYNFKTSK
jgi:hypothetical protein